MFGQAALAQTQTEEVILELMEGLDIAENRLLFNKLLHYSEHPINLNKCKAAELASLQLLSREQIEKIINHRNINGHFHSIYELQSVTGLNIEAIHRIIPFVAVNYSRSLKERSQALFASGYNYSLASYKSTVETNKGLRSGVYVGSPGRSQIRSKLNSPGNISVGIVAQKDAGEKWPQT